MKLLILSPEKDWTFIKEDLAKETMGQGIDYEVKHFPLLPQVPREEYRQGLWGVSRRYLTALLDIYEGDVVLFHFPNFQIEGAGGWFSVLNGIPVIQAYGPHTRKFTRTGEFTYWFAELIAHEMAHKYYWKVNLEDRTHYWHYERKELLGAFREIITTLKKVLSLWQTIKVLTKKVAGLKMHEEEVIEKDYFCIHHSATARDLTRTETIINNGIREYGKSFYDIIIDKDGVATYPNAIIKERGTKDICVLGDFTKEKPTDKQIETLKSIIEGQDYTTHKELAEKGLATPSLCPGKLMNYLDI